eukprot:6029_1
MINRLYVPILRTPLYFILAQSSICRCNIVLLISTISQTARILLNNQSLDILSHNDVNDQVGSTKQHPTKQLLLHFAPIPTTLLPILNNKMQQKQQNTPTNTIKITIKGLNGVRTDLTIASHSTILSIKKRTDLTIQTH